MKTWSLNQNVTWWDGKPPTLFLLGNFIILNSIKTWIPRTWCTYLANDNTIERYMYSFIVRHAQALGYVYLINWHTHQLYLRIIVGNKDNCGLSNNFKLRIMICRILKWTEEKALAQSVSLGSNFFWELDRKKMFWMPPCCISMLARTSLTWPESGCNSESRLSGRAYLKCLFWQFNCTPTSNSLPCPLLRLAIAAFVSAWQIGLWRTSNSDLEIISGVDFQRRVK